VLCDQTTVAHRPIVALVLVAQDWNIGQAGSPSTYCPEGFTSAAQAAGVMVASTVNSIRTSSGRPAPYRVSGGVPAGMKTVPV
jgi:hypothetical protein